MKRQKLATEGLSDELTSLLGTGEPLAAEMPQEIQRDVVKVSAAKARPAAKPAAKPKAAPTVAAKPTPRQRKRPAEEPIVDIEEGWLEAALSTSVIEEFPTAKAAAKPKAKPSAKASVHPPAKRPRVAKVEPGSVAETDEASTPLVKAVARPAKAKSGAKLELGDQMTANAAAKQVSQPSVVLDREEPDTAAFLKAKKELSATQTAALIAETAVPAVPRVRRISKTPSDRPAGTLQTLPTPFRARTTSAVPEASSLTLPTSKRRVSKTPPPTPVVVC